MIFVSSIIFLVGLPSALLTEALSEGSMTVKELPKDVMGELVDIVNGTLSLNRRSCLLLQDPSISFLLYTRNNPDNPIVLNPNNPTQINPSKKVIVVVHGWLGSATAYGIPELKNAYLTRYDCSVIILDWSNISRDLYTTSYCELPNIANLGAQFLCTLNIKFNIALSDVHLLGHSLGAHLTGYIGKYTVTNCQQKVGRITGLDPAGPLYQGVSANERLDKSDATFVDVIHTNALQYGYWGNIGDADFYVNCGVLQTGCPQIDITNIFDTVVSVVACSHLRCLDIMTESIISGGFVAKSCSNCPVLCLSDTFFPTFAIMGEDCPTNLRDTKYWISIGASSPYAIGCTPYPNEC